MVPVDQTKLYNPDKKVNGNCMAACFASILEISLSDVPEIEDMDDWFPLLNKWLKSLGFVMVQWPSEEWFPGYCLVSGISERGIMHMVIFNNGLLIHDPHPSRSGVKNIESQWVLIPINPTQYGKQKII